MFEQTKFTNQIEKIYFLSKRNRLFKIYYRTKRYTYQFDQISSNQELININQSQEITNVFKIR